MEQGFILYPTYQATADGATVQLTGRLENGATFRADIKQIPYFFIAASDAERAKELTELALEETKLTTLDGAPVKKVTVRIPKDVPPLRKQLEDGGIPCYEADIRFSYRYLIDNGLTASIGIDGQYEKGVHVDRIYKEPRIVRGDWKGELSVLSFDIETDRKSKELWCVSLVCGKRTERLIVGKEVKDATSCKTEKELLERLTALVKEIDPDIITGWNVIDFDLQVLEKLYAKYGLPFAWARSDRPCKLRVQKSYMRDSRADIPGRMVLDGLSLLRTSFIKLDSYTLESVAEEVLGDGKIFKGKDRHRDIQAAYKDDPALLLDYNEKDARLVLDILDKSGALALTIKRSLLTGMQLDRVKASIASLDMLYLPRLRKRGHVAPTSGYVTKEERITGGFVMSSKPGVFDYVIVCDFKSLYPSIMRTLNIDPLAYQPAKKQEKSSAKFVVAENGAVFSQEAGILPDILAELWAERDKARAEKDELRRYAIKILMNSFFGVLASPNCRFFSLDMANAITKTGQHLIKTTAEHIREQGYEVIYGDTDSLFIDLKIDDEKQASEIGKTIEKDVNAFLKTYVEDRYKRPSFLELEYEKTYVRFLMPKTRSGEGSKKRYAGLLVKDGKEDIDFTGLEFVRRDWTDLAKDFQLGILDRVFHRRDPAPFIRSFVEEVRAGKHDDLLVYRKALRKSVEEYTKTTPPHVKAAKLLDEIRSNIIEYVQTVDGPEPLGKVTHSIDYEHYIDKQLKPIADSILVFYKTSFADVLLGTTQKGLFEF